MTIPLGYGPDTNSVLDAPYVRQLLFTQPQRPNKLYLSGSNRMGERDSNPVAGDIR
ncbi:hypothetical protein BN2476_150028 [Paraburkholderia piptadeniae]|uniref:Uncharacterized protein n=1 Tax=Paraburkholderia piptadeniae TaxID=1701573 RepID=A0A1N7RTI2_9BURK|nr:hypothetical protein BN2476_150028 [Paraburkholderia piptadeniae]